MQVTPIGSCPTVKCLTRVRTLANEEPDITAVAFRPGLVDTDVCLRYLSTIYAANPGSRPQMQTALRDSPDKMTPADHQRFIKAHAEGTLVPPDTSGYLIASLVLKARKELHGQYISNTAPELEEYQKK